MFLGETPLPARVAIEACREAWSVHDRLRNAGHEPVLVDTTRVKQLGIGAHRRKTDRIDAEVLARALEANRIPRAHVLSPARREDPFCSSRYAEALVETRTQYITTVRGLVRAAGKKLGGCATENFVSRFRKAQFD